MGNSTEDQTRPAPSRFRPRFTLAALLALVTLSALGAWYWWRVPFEVEVPGKGNRTVETVRRVWGGKTLRHGPLYEFDKDGHKIAEIHYHEGLLHGTSQRWFTDGHIREQGQHQFGRKHGEWVRFHENREGAPTHFAYSKNISHWENGIPDGKWESIDTQGTTTTSVEFVAGKLVRPLPSAAEEGLASNIADGELADPVLLSKLFSPLRWRSVRRHSRTQ